MTAPTLELHDIQGMVLRHRPEPYWGSNALLRVDVASQGRELLRRVTPLINSADRDGQQRDGWFAVALTYSGLAALGVPKESLMSFPAEFRAGMAARADVLGQTGESSPEHWERPYGTGEIHIALTMLCGEENAWRDLRTRARAKLEELPGVTLLRERDYAQLLGGRAPFGYRDGISMPYVAGSGLPELPGQGSPIAAGEFILGYDGEAGFPLPAPTPEILARNGTFIGLLKFQTLDGAFRRFLRENSRGPDEEELLAAKLLGRWRSGAPLALSPDADDPELAEDLKRRNDFDFADDPRGLKCPLGSHIRRLNPRETPLKTLTDVKLHRIIRHGMTYGPPLPEGVLEDDGAERGMLFIFASAKAPKTLEFLMGQWMNDGNFLGLGDEKDPVAGSNDGTGTYTIPQHPIRRRLHGLARFTVLRGGEYAFVPGLRALKWISALSEAS